MRTSNFDPGLVPTSVSVDDAFIRVRFVNGLETATPLSRFPRLAGAAPEQRVRWRIIGQGDGIHWPDADEDISVHGLFGGTRPVATSPMEEIPALIGELYGVTNRLNELFRGRPFTPDGHLVGSIGEVVAEYIYGLKLEPCSTPQVDAHTDEAQRRSVQIRLTGVQGKSHGMRWSRARAQPAPDLLIALKLSEQGFVEVYNGPFPVDLLDDRADQKNGQLAVSVRRLEERNPRTLPERNKFSSLNRWFKPQLSDVA